MAYSTDLLTTKKRLTQWGHWCHQIITMGLGYSNQSLIAKLQAEGGVIVRGTTKMLIPTNKQAEELNDLIEQLAAEQPDGEGKAEWAKVIRIHYTMPDKDVQERIQYTSLPRSTYFRYLKDAQNWLSKYITVH
ncbi:MAG: hypothetical protein KIT27_00480 [Legionellales bacterium]|nr:hypothetical protein [Legionellales bacterium]